MLSGVSRTSEATVEVRMAAVRRVLGLVAGLVVGVTAALFGGVRADAGTIPVGPAIGANKYQGTIGEAGDSDDFTGSFVAGEKLTVTVAATGPKKTVPSLRPVLVLVDPDGLARVAGAVTSSNGLSTAFKNFVVDKPGLWAARVSGKDDTTGDYLVSFKVKARPKIAFPKEQLGGNQPFSREYRFPGFDGATFTATAVDSKKSTPVVFQNLTDPTGAPVLGAGGSSAVTSAVRKGNRLELKGVVLHGASGDYVLKVTIPSGEGAFSLSLTVTAPARPVSKKTLKLGALEPVLDPRAVPIAADVGDTVTFTGANFSTPTPPAVIFGASRAETVTSAPDGKSLQVVVPPKSGDTFVPIYVINSDGQGTVRDGYFAYQPPPVISDLVDATSGAQVRSARADGSRPVRLLGLHFEPGYVVRVGTAVVPQVNLVGETEYRFNLPALPQGNYSVTVTDPFQRTATSEFTVFLKTAPAFAANPYTPGAVRLTTPTSVTISGTGFEAADQLVFQGQNVASTFVDAATRRFTVPGLSAGAYTVRLVDSIGTIVDGPAIYVKGPPAITSATVVSGAVINGNEIPLSGGPTVQVDGTAFAPNDAVTLGGTTITTFSVNTTTRKTFTTPAGTAGFAALTITDGAGQSATLSNAVRYVGFRDATAAHEPSYTSADNFGAVRGAVADLDRDGRVDDVVLVAPIGASIGTRSELTRVLYGNAAGVLTDQTSSAIPSARSDAAGADTWDATCVAVGDVDGVNGADILIGGQVSQYYGSYRQVRLLRNNGSGAFSLDETYGPPTRDDSYVTAYVPPTTGYYYYYSYGFYIPVFGYSTQRGTPQALALGDLDGDNDLDLVVGTDHFQSRYVYIDPQYVDFTQTPPLVLSISNVNYTQYRAALRVYENRFATSEGLVDRSATHVPGAGDSNNRATQPAALHCRDLAIGDVDNDGDRDVVITWDDPMTVTAYGLSTFETYGSSYDTAHVATRVLLNNGSGKLTIDGTTVWMPAGSGSEYWHADRMSLADLNNDGYPEIVLLLDESLDAWTGTATRVRRALRVLRNDRTKFTDVTSTVLPAPVTANADDFRGEGLAVRDVNGDGYRDILISTTEALRSNTGVNVPRLRVFYGSSAFTFALRPEFGVQATVDTGEARDLLFVPDLGGTGKERLLLVGDSVPATNPGSGVIRAQEWKR
jgi:hypothetical protein